MELTSLLFVLSLATTAQSWPKQPLEVNDLVDRTTLPLIPLAPASVSTAPAVNKDVGPMAALATGVAPDDDLSERTVGVRNSAAAPAVSQVDKDVSEKRSILDDDDDPAGWMTLPVPRLSSREGEDKRAVESPSGVLSFPIVRAAKSGLSRRGVVEVQVENRSDVSYYAQLNIGTPPQKVYAQIDTGSFELWVNPDCSNVRTADQKFCRAIGHYNPASSSTSQNTGQTNDLKYGIGSANINYVLDNIALPGSDPMTKVQFGVASESSDEFSGILGIGYGLGFNTEYRNFIDELDAQGVTKTKAFSLALGSKDETEGAIIFGGVDTSKFEGTLAPVPIVPAEKSPDGVARYWISMNSITVSPPSGKSNTIPKSKTTVFLDSGSTLTLLPPAVVQSIANALGVQQIGEGGLYTVDCDLANQNGSIDFAFNGVTIKVPYSEMVRSMATLPPSCYLGVMPSTEFSLLGDTFLRSAYVVFDVSANMTYLAPYSNCGTKLQTISSSSDLEKISSTCNVESGGDSSNGGADPNATSTITAQPVTFMTVSPSATGSPTGAATATQAAAAAAQSSAVANKDSSQEASKSKSSAGRIGIPTNVLGVALAVMGLMMVV